MNETYGTLVGKDIELRSQMRTYRFRCTKAERINEVNLALHGIGPQPDSIFTQYSTIVIAGREWGAAVEAVKDCEADHFHITVEVVVTDSGFWV